MRSIPAGIFNSLKNAYSARPTRQVEKARERTAREPLEPLNHYRLGDALASMKNWSAAIAEYRTGMALGIDNEEGRLSLASAYRAAGLSGPGAFESATPRDEEGPARTTHAVLRAAPLNLDHNRYFRLLTLAEHILSLYRGRDVAILDVGGGDGALSLFLPSARYVLAEPSINGISGMALPFAEKSFNVVVACHVLEHIPAEDRTLFLDMLASRAEGHVLLLNPFSQPEGDDRERLNIVIELTGALWAKEHLSCTLPDIEEVARFASERGLGFRAWPNGNLYTSLALVFLDHYARLAGEEGALRRINAFFNGQRPDRLTSADVPAAWLVELDVDTGKM